MVEVLMVGTGEYTTGYGKASAQSDKAAGVVGLVLIDLRSRGLVGRLGLCGTSGTKLPDIRAHMQRAIVEAYPASKFDASLDTFPADSVARDPEAFRAAIAAFPPGSCATIFTPDETHYDIAMACVERGLHVLVTKPPVMTLEQHQSLMAAAERHKVFVMVVRGGRGGGWWGSAGAANVCARLPGHGGRGARRAGAEWGVESAQEVHKRFDPIYVDARDRLRALGDFSYMTAYMSQPKRQLSTFSAWAGKSPTDISYYLNSHHVDFCEWALRGRARAVRVTAMASTGVADPLLGLSAGAAEGGGAEGGGEKSAKCEDTITLMVQWENLASGNLGVGVYTSSWIAPPSDVHSQQRFFAMAHGGEVTVDQAHRGYSCATDAGGFASVNPLFMKYAPSSGAFAGQLGYGYRSIEAFVRAVADLRDGKVTLDDLNRSDLASIQTTAMTTAILEAGRRSLDNRGRAVRIRYAAPRTPASEDAERPTALELE
jgi:D-galacturonate reductase